MPKILIGIIVVILLGGGAYYYMQVVQPGEDEPVTQEGAERMDDETMMEGEEYMDDEVMMMESHVVVFSDSGYAPKELTIHKGDTVIFKNTASQDTWPATAVHPTHTVYPGSDIQKCFDGMSDTSVLFDACAGIAPGSDWSFTFNEVGTWNYHDHLGAANWGTIIVEE